MPGLLIIIVSFYDFPTPKPVERFSFRPYDFSVFAVPSISYKDLHPRPSTISLAFCHLTYLFFSHFLPSYQHSLLIGAARFTPLPSRLSPLACTPNVGVAWYCINLTQWISFFSVIGDCGPFVV